MLISNLGPKLFFAAAMLATAMAGAAAQAPSSDAAGKILRCRQNVSELIFLDRKGLLERCGLWSSETTTKTANGEIERLVYSRYFVVTLRNGVVSSVRQRRQIFTGFKKRL